MSLTGRDPSTYERHRLHSPERTYTETNCYADVVLELLHAVGYEPLAMFAHVVRMDFEGDQWTFFKPPPEDLELLYGVDIHEMNPYRPIPDQIAEQLGLGRSMIVELDSWYLPDLQTTSYRTEHVKTSCAFDLIDPDAERLNYFHGPGFFTLEGEDYRGVFRIGAVADEVLPPYCEIVRFDAAPPREGEALKLAALESLRRNLERAPADNPFPRFSRSLAETLPALLQGEMQAYHRYAFATVRILGSGFEALSSFTDWLFGDDGRVARTAMDDIVARSKVLSFRLARRRAFDPEELTLALATSYERALGALAELAR